MASYETLDEIRLLFGGTFESFIVLWIFLPPLYTSCVAVSGLCVEFFVFVTRFPHGFQLLRIFICATWSVIFSNLRCLAISLLCFHNRHVKMCVCIFA